MSYPPKIDCFVCGRAKGETNHWYLVQTRVSHAFNSQPAEQPAQYAGQRRWLEMTDFYEDGAGKPTCGNNCTQKLVERWLQTGTLEPQRGSAADATRGAAGEPA